MFRVLVGKKEGKRPLGRPRPSSEEYNIINPRETGFKGESIQCINVAQDCGY